MKVNSTVVGLAPPPPQGKGTWLIRNELSMGAVRAGTKRAVKIVFKHVSALSIQKEKQKSMTIRNYQRLAKN